MWRSARVACLLVAIASSVLLACPPALAEETLITEGDLSFKAEPFGQRDVPIRIMPFYWPYAAPVSGETTSVVKRYIGGAPYDMALRQAEFGYRYLSSYRLTGKQWYLDQAKAQADYLIAMHDPRDEGWFFPSTFSWWLDRKYGYGFLDPPWYSGIAQGAAVGFLARLSEATGDPAYQDAAEHALESFLLEPQIGRPWISAVDDEGYLCIEEYPETEWHFVLNGHIEAAMGLLDYYRVTGDDRGLSLYRGALTSVLRYGQRFRNARWASAYSLGARAPYVGYHRFVGAQLLQLYSLSGDPRFAALANSFDDDYPITALGGKVAVIAGTYPAYKFDSSGRTVSTAWLRAAGEKTYNFRQRARARNRAGYWFVLQGGALDGYHVRESAGSVYCRGMASVVTYPFPLVMTLRSGRWGLAKIDATGTVLARRSLIAVDLPDRGTPSGETSPTSRTAQVRTLVEAPGTAVMVERRAVVNGAPMVLIASGRLAGYWAPRASVALP